MLVYPEVKHKLPPLFKLIVDQDNLRSELIRQPVVMFDMIKKLKLERLSLTKAAENAIKQMKKDSAPTNSTI